jgi:methionine biosynthesis protein MetW
MSKSTFSDIPYYDNFNEEIYKLIDCKSKVLDVGCSSGRLIGELKNKKGCYVVGIEKIQEMINIAKEKSDRIIEADLNEICEMPFPKNYFDVIIFGDVLEHLQDPERTLRYFYEYLSDSGYILVSIPNIAFITVRFNLLIGKFDYSDCGILDRTHIHFYTLNSAKELLEHCGYKIQYVGNYNPARREYYYFLKIASKISKSLFSIDFIFKAIKKDN